MKLKNKLLPLVGVATACAAVAPIALTSCKSNTSDFVDLTTLYKPTIEMYSKDHGNEELTQEEANKIYFGDSYKEEEGDKWTDDATLVERIKQEYSWSKSLASYMYNGRSYSSNDILQGKINYIKIGHETVLDLLQTPRLVPTLSIQIEFKTGYKYEGSYYNKESTSNGITTITNLPICVSPYENSTSGDIMWHVTPDWEEISLEYVTERTTNTIPFFFNEDSSTEYNETYVESGYSRHNSSSDSISFYGGILNQPMPEDTSHTMFEKFQYYYDGYIWDDGWDWNNFGYNFTSYYLFGNGVKGAK